MFDICDEFVVAFEDRTDFDYQDIVFSIKKLSCGGSVCGNGITEFGEECDDGNMQSGDGCDAECFVEEEICEHDVGVRYSYSQSLGTGIRIIMENGTNVLSNPAQLNNGEVYEVRYGIKNKIANTTNNVRVIVKLDNTVLANYTRSINIEFYNSTFLNTSQFAPGNYVITLDVSKINETDCNLTDNHAEREIAIINIPCDDNLDCGTDFSSDNFCIGDNIAVNYTRFICNNPGTPQSYCSNITTTNETQQCLYGCSDGTCEEPVCGNGIREGNEECDDDNLIDGDGCSNQCTIEVCVPKTCQQLGKECGTWNNGCNQTIDCGPEYKVCSVDYGTCKEYGREYCDNGQYSDICEGTEDPREDEICDDRDNDCDNLVDEGLICEECEDRDEDHDGVNDCDDLCPDSEPEEPVDQDGCDIFQFCEGNSCGFNCYEADWMNNEEERFPHDCTVVMVLRNGKIQQPKCVPTEFSNMCAG